VRDRATYGRKSRGGNDRETFGYQGDPDDLHLRTAVPGRPALLGRVSHRVLHRFRGRIRT
jgi:hypothetical protein